MQKGKAGSRKGSRAQLVPLTGSGFSSFLSSLPRPSSSPFLSPPLFLLLFGFFFKTPFVAEAPARGALAPVSVSRFTLGPFTTN